MYLNLNADYDMFVDGKIISVVVWNMLFNPHPTPTTTNTHTNTQRHTSQIFTQIVYCYIYFLFNLSPSPFSP